MTLVVRIMRRLLGRTRGDEGATDLEREWARGRIGRGGGRRRHRSDGNVDKGSGADGSTTVPSDARDTAGTPFRIQSRRPSGRNRAGRQTRRSLLDEPLPEDLAFRPAAEGGDKSIVPGRRRPPRFRTTPRVMAGGSRYVTGFSASELHESDNRSTSDGSNRSTSDGSSEDSGGDTTKESEVRRRRRGGRGRRGRGSGSDNGSENEKA